MRNCQLFPCARQPSLPRTIRLTSNYKYKSSWVIATESGPQIGLTDTQPYGRLAFGHSTLYPSKHLGKTHIRNGSSWSIFYYQTRIALLVIKLVISWWITQFTTVIVIPSCEGKLSEPIDRKLTNPRCYFALTIFLLSITIWYSSQHITSSMV